MSSVIVAGDTSGSVTLQAPAVSGSTVLTLPTTTGTLVVNSGAQTIEFADGSASAPSITNSGDTNTGIFFPAADTIAFSEGGAESMRLDSSGNLGINTTVPRSKFESVSGIANTNADTAGTAGAFIGPTSSGENSIVTIESNDAIAANTGGVLGFGGRYLGTQYARWATIKGLKDNASAGDYGGYLAFYTRANGAASAERMRIPSTGGIQSVNCVSVGNATPSTSGAGITFPATQSASTDANTLDDYEEGTWTPVFTPTSGAIGSYNAQSGQYTKVGRAVTVTCYMALSSKGTAGGTLSVTGLPFISGASNGFYTSCSMYLNTLTGLTGNFVSYLPPNAAFIAISYLSNQNSTTSITPAMLSNGSDFMISMTYMTA
jgi:hypothetical protein